MHVTVLGASLFPLTDGGGGDVGHDNTGQPGSTHLTFLGSG